MGAQRRQPKPCSAPHRGGLNVQRTERHPVAVICDFSGPMWSGGVSSTLRHGAHSRQLISEDRDCSIACNPGVAVFRVGTATSAALSYHTCSQSERHCDQGRLP